MAQRNKLEISQRTVAIVTGVVLLVMAVAAFRATDFLERLMILKDTPHLKSVELLLQNSILGWLIIFISDILVAWGFYIFLKKPIKAFHCLQHGSG